MVPNDLLTLLSKPLHKDTIFTFVNFIVCFLCLWKYKWNTQQKKKSNQKNKGTNKHSFGQITKQKILGKILTFVVQVIYTMRKLLNVTEMNFLKIESCIIFLNRKSQYYNVHQFSPTWSKDSVQYHSKSHHHFSWGSKSWF